jgi:uncharacterized integral membrane protein (TIGR00701 family)
LLDVLTPWLKALHFVSLFIWSACLFSLPAIFAAHRSIATVEEAIQLRAATRFAYIAIASPAAITAIASGTALIYPTSAYGGWLPLKLTLVAFMSAFHVALGRITLMLHDNPKAWPTRFHALLALAPAPLVLGVLYLVLAKPL